MLVDCNNLALIRNSQQVQCCNVKIGSILKNEKKISVHLHNSVNIRGMICCTQLSYLKGTNVSVLK